MKSCFARLSFSLVLALAISSCSSTPKNAGSAEKGLFTQTYTATDPGFAVNSHLIIGQKDLILVDAQFTKTDTKKVIEMIRATGKNLTTVFITHGHPDHYFGLEEVKAAFPSAKILTTTKVQSDVRSTSKAKLAYWKTQYKDEMPKAIVHPEKTTQKELTLEGHKIMIFEVTKGESDGAAVLYIPAIKTLVAGDLIYNRVHLWLAENQPSEWLKNLETVKNWAMAQGGVDLILSGHGENGSAGLFAENRDYIQAYVQSTTSATTKQQALDSMMKKFSNYKVPIIADLSVGARLKK